MPATAATDDALFASLESALIAVEFAHLTDEHDIAQNAEAEIRTLTAEALNRGYVLDTLNCGHGDRVLGPTGHTGTITAIAHSPHAPRLTVSWDSPAALAAPTTFTGAMLTAGLLRHAR